MHAHLPTMTLSPFYPVVVSSPKETDLQPEKCQKLRKASPNQSPTCFPMCYTTNIGIHFSHIMSYPLNQLIVVLSKLGQFDKYH